MHLNPPFGVTSKTLAHRCNHLHMAANKVMAICGHLYTGKHVKKCDFSKSFLEMLGDASFNYLCFNIFEIGGIEADYISF